MDKLKVAVVGVGSMGKSHARNYADMDNVDLVGVCDVNKELGSAVAKKYHTNYYEKCNELISKEKVDAVSICVPTKFHAKTAIDVIKKDIHVLVEKPIASSIDEAKKMIDEAQKQKVKLMVGHIERFNPAVVAVKKMLNEKQLGKIYQVYSSRLSPFPNRIVDVGVTIDLAVHEIDIMHYLINSKIKSIYAMTSQKIHSNHEDLLIATMKFSNDIIGVINCNWLTPKKVREMNLIGEKGLLHVNYLTQELFFYKNHFTEQIDYGKDFMNVIEGDMVKIRINTKEPLRNELEAFAECVLKNTKEPVCGEEGLEALKIAQKFIESANKNKIVKL